MLVLFETAAGFALFKVCICKFIRILGFKCGGLFGCEIIFCWIWPHTTDSVTRILAAKYFAKPAEYYAGCECAISRQAYCGSLRHIWPTKWPASRKSVMPHSGRILCRDIIPSAVRGGRPHRACQTRVLRIRHGIIFRRWTILRFLRRACLYSHSEIKVVECFFGIYQAEVCYLSHA